MKSAHIAAAYRLIVAASAAVNGQYAAAISWLDLRSYDDSRGYRYRRLLLRGEARMAAKILYRRASEGGWLRVSGTLKFGIESGNITFSVSDECPYTTHAYYQPIPCMHGDTPHCALPRQKYEDIGKWFPGAQKYVTGYGYHA